jgi:hypothetical protein
MIRHLRLIFLLGVVVLQLAECRRMQAALRERSDFDGWELEFRTQERSA